MIRFYNRPTGDLVGQRVYVYRNLTKGCWSLKSLKTGKVVAHADNLVLKDVIFKVSEAGRQRVLRDKRKNVHAGVVGTIQPPTGPEGARHLGSGYFNGLNWIGRPVTYNPYKGGTFVTRGPYPNDLGPVYRSDGAIFNGSSVYAVDLEDDYGHGLVDGLEEEDA